MDRWKKPTIVISFSLMGSVVSLIFTIMTVYPLSLFWNTIRIGSPFTEFV
ncbi:hypothetical protein NBRC111894_4136 [Sporolactobacillus inulinus]|uniref:Uncharacterized protein n=1 Tax=Sporolactobacillus inulinus TaxID=2078 RepID=A0A4Y1ZHA4_9BACL|nr:hypothetical protein [Sporolactobacillus inulinus]GAY78582.1 hypothetical protein NBRC111894_4136 [Sporolactobacillus inulinus]